MYCFFLFFVFLMLSSGLIFLTFLHIRDEEMEAQKASKQNKLMKTETFPNNYQFKYLEKHKWKRNYIEEHFIALEDY